MGGGGVSAGDPARHVATGDTIRAGGVRFRVLWPDRSAVPTTASSDGRVVNDSSIVLLGEADGARFLLSGDAEDGIDPTLVSRGLPHVALYKVAHHGSRTASSDALLAALSPWVTAISVGADNTYGHPSPATLGRLAAHGARVLRTDRDGHGDRDDRRRAPRRPRRACRADARRRGRRHRAHGGRRRRSCTIGRMTVPGRIEAAAILLSLDPPPWFLRHARAVAEIAGMARRARGGRGRCRGPAPRGVGRTPP